MTKTMWEVIELLYRIYKERGVGAYLELWQIQSAIGIELEGCGCQGDPAINDLLRIGLIEEVPELRFRYWIKVIA